jgi:hypothetical protein
LLTLKVDAALLRPWQVSVSAWSWLPTGLTKTTAHDAILDIVRRCARRLEAVVVRAPWVLNLLYNFCAEAATSNLAAWQRRRLVR